MNAITSIKKEEQHCHHTNRFGDSELILLLHRAFDNHKDSNAVNETLTCLGPSVLGRKLAM
jgi:hypothetical protein